MRAGAATLAVVAVLLTGTYADARDPLREKPSVAPPDGPLPDRFAFVVPPGLYYVTETYVGNIIVATGATTTYSTTTVHESTGTYARVVDIVGTGTSSAFDGLAFNGRGALGDGRSLAGTYYENFVLTASGYVPVSIVFFQDDSETRRAATSHSPLPTATAASTPSTTTAPLATPPTTTTSIATRPAAAPSPTRRPPMPSPRPSYRTGVALAQDGPLLTAAEVLRGRVVQFWPRVLSNDVAVPLRSWRLLSTAPDRDWGREGSTGPFSAQWIRMPAPNVPWLLRFEVITATAPSERLEAQIAITVRSPALID